MKICAGAENRTPAEILTGRAGTTGRYSTGEMPPIKAERPEPSDHLRSTCLRIIVDKKGLFIGKKDSPSSVVKHIFSSINDKVSC